MTTALLAAVLPLTLACTFAVAALAVALGACSASRQNYQGASWAGAQPPAPSLGRMLSEGREYMFMAPWASLFSGLAILLASLGFNLLGDGLRDRLDPRLRGID